MSNRKLPVHGFVLAGGKSSRMGQDKALLPFLGRPMIEIAAEKLREFCAEVSIVGNREDLQVFSPVVREERLDVGPVAGIEAGLLASTQPWAMFMPVDVPLVPLEVLRTWAAAVVERQSAGCAASYLLVNQHRQPAFCVMRRECCGSVKLAIERGERRLDDILMSIDSDKGVGWLWIYDVGKSTYRSTPLNMEFWFSNVNTPQELAAAEAWLAASKG
ncbi:MAG TPA: molybdenum cofactor guanylyltransferase [Granulicella sp.]